MKDKKVILVTGASSGMGKDGALHLIRDGHIVYGGARRVDRMKDLVENGGHSIELDVTNVDSIKKAVDKIIAEQGRIDVLWNNAGYSVSGAVENVTYEDAKRQFEVNNFGLAEVTKAVLPYMRAQNAGKIINTTSVGGKITTPLGAWYHASKFALEGWSDCLRLELKPFNIDVVILQPGGVATEFGDVMYKPLIERAKGSAYEKFTMKIAQFYKNQFDHPERLSSPAVISNTVSKILKAKNPKTRYSTGKGSTIILFLRRILTDKMFDKMIMTVYR